MSGTTSFSNSSRFPFKSLVSLVSPVIFPPGRAKLSTMPVATGSRCHHNNGNRLGCLLGCKDRMVQRDKDINLELHEFSYEIRNLVPLSLNVAILNQDVFSFYVTKISQPLPECLDLRTRIAGVTKSGHVSYPRNFRGLLRSDEIDRDLDINVPSREARILFFMARLVIFCSVI